MSTRLLTVAEVAEHLGEDVRTTRRRIRRGELRAINKGGTANGRRYRVEASELARFKAARAAA